MSVLLYPWKFRAELRVIAGKLFAEGDELRTKGGRLRAKAGKLFAEGDKLSTKARSKLHTRAHKLAKEANRPSNEAGKLFAESNKLISEADKLFAKAVFEVYGNVDIEWLDDGCRVVSEEFKDITEAELDL